MVKKRGRPRKIKQEIVEEKKEEVNNTTLQNLTTPKFDLSFKKTTKRLSLNKTLYYNKIIDYIIDNFSKWEVTGRGTYFLDKTHTIEYDGYSLPIIDGEYLLSDVLTDKMPEDIVIWMESLINDN